MSENTSVYADILKYDDNGDGTLTVFGKATDDALDIDQQICDPVWLDKAMPDWFRTGGNIREQHSNIAAGVAQEMLVGSLPSLQQFGANHLDASERVLLS